MIRTIKILLLKWQWRRIKEYMPRRKRNALYELVTFIKYNK